MIVDCPYARVAGLAGYLASLSSIASIRLRFHTEIEEAAATPLLQRTLCSFGLYQELCFVDEAEQAQSGRWRR